jgi:hypothetical protein
VQVDVAVAVEVDRITVEARRHELRHADRAGIAAAPGERVDAFVPAEDEPALELVDRAVLLAPDIVPTFTAAQMVERGARLPEAATNVASLLALVELQNGDAVSSYVVGTSNFYTLTRYNWSSYYAMAVLALGETVATAVNDAR